MNERIKDLILYRVSRSKEAYDEAILLGDNNHWNACANRLYYACFYMVNALLLCHDFSFSSHNGVKISFHQHFVKTGKISKEFGKTYSRIFNLRQEGDYTDFKRYNEQDIKPFIAEVRHFIYEVERQLQ